MSFRLATESYEYLYKLAKNLLKCWIVVFLTYSPDSTVSDSIAGEFEGLG